MNLVKKFGRICCLQISFLLIFLLISDQENPTFAQSFTIPSGYQQIYSLEIPESASWFSSQPGYTVNNSGKSIGMIESIGYYVNLDDNWVWVSMNPFTNDLTKIGVPTKSSGASFQTKVDGMQYQSNVAALGNSNAQTAGNIEFWPNDYSQGNAISIPNANASGYDFGDTRTVLNTDSGGFGSMQIHDYGNSQTVFAMNHWGYNTNNRLDAGIGNSANNEKDWTFSGSAMNYTTRTLEVYAKPVIFAAAKGSTQEAVIAAETANMNLIYRMDIPQNGTLSAANYSINNVVASQSLLKGMPLRVGYYLEMTRADGTSDYVYTSMEGLTNNVAKTGLPLAGTDWSFQKNVSNMTVQSNVSGVVNGTGIQTGNVEMWNTNYSEGLGNPNVSGGSSTIFDFNDKKEAGSYACFQVHNYGASQTVFALNRWNGAAQSGTFDLGIGNSPSGSKDWTFNGQGASPNIAQYATSKLYVMAAPVIAPMMSQVADGADYSVVQGQKITSVMKTNLHDNGTPYDIVNNVSSMQSAGMVFDRIGYYMEIAPTVDSELQYVFVSMDAFTSDLSKIGVPDVKSGELYQQTVKNLSVSSNVSTVATGTGIHGAIEFWPSNYSTAGAASYQAGDNGKYDYNDSGAEISAGHGSMQIHNLDAKQTVFALNDLKADKQFGIGPCTNPVNNGLDWTFNTSNQNAAIANIYTFVRPSDAVLFTDDTKSGIDFYQRNSETGSAQVTLSGTFKLAQGANLTSIQASENGTDWIDLGFDAATGTFSSTLDLKGGWHQFTYRAMNGSSVLTTTTGDKIGVGEIFITAGQSNSTNYGDSATSPTSGNVVALNHVTGEWGIANDPQPTNINGASDNSGRGSTWPTTGDALSEALGVPVAFSSVGWGGTKIQWWDPDASGSGFDRLSAAIQELDGNFAGILWHQGESDYGIAEVTYEQALRELISASRDEAGWDVPWEIALVSYVPGKGNDDNVRAAQYAVAEDGTLTDVFLGPDSDSLLGIYRGQNTGNGIHFSVLGLETLGELWAYEISRDMYGVPEPSTWVLFLGTVLGMGTLGLRQRAKRARSL